MTHGREALRSNQARLGMPNLCHHVVERHSQCAEFGDGGGLGAMREVALSHGPGTAHEGVDRSRDTPRHQVTPAQHQRETRHRDPTLRQIAQLNRATERNRLSVQQKPSLGAGVEA